MEVYAFTRPDNYCNSIIGHDWWGIVDILGRREKNRQIIEEHKRNQLEIQKDKKRIESELKKFQQLRHNLSSVKKYKRYRRNTSTFI